jgi:anti-sigma regulatory factor (Ser/Thr protein kinase)
MVTHLLGGRLPADDMDDLLQSVGEAVANAIQHGRGLIRVHVELTDHQATVRVRDSGNGFDPELLKADDLCSGPGAESGRGLHIMRQMSDSVSAYSGAGCTVSITKSLGEAPPWSLPA